VTVRRRDFLQSAALGICAAPTFALGDKLATLRLDTNEESFVPPTRSVVPVVGDGKWIWNKPPEDATGYLEPRRFRLQVGIDVIGKGNVEGVTATTPVPIAAPEQEIVSERVRTEAAQAVIESIASNARQLRIFVPRLGRGDKATAVGEFELELRKQYFAYESMRFPAVQTVPADVRKEFLGDSPGIQTRSAGVLSLLKQINTAQSFVERDPWLQAQAFAKWVGKHIVPKVGLYTSVDKALENRTGDCEEMAGVFVALCRSAGIPARLVWIPNHVWSEFYVSDSEGKGHWIPAHTACYHWFGWTGAHELVLQKGDRLKVPGKGTLVRLQQDRTQWLGTKPEVKFWAELTPIAADDTEVALEAAGPGARRKEPTGEWVPIGKHPYDKYLRR
jgi:hypothetical protein